MEAKKLRLGNYIGLTERFREFCESRNVDTNILKVTKISFQEIELNRLIDANVTTIEGIPLTERWLIKFGFYQEEINDSWNIDTKEDVFALDSCLEFMNYEHSPLNYVHELQNLFFAITGQELELKDES